MTPFIITGMPRCRTAWLANYLTTGSFCCEHEFLSRFPMVELAAEQILIREIGISDSGAVWFQRRLRSLIPEAKWVVIRRDSGEASESLQEACGRLLDLHRHLEKVEEACEIPGVMLVEFEELDDRVVDIARFCFPGWVHDQDRHNQLCRFNVTLKDEILRSKLDNFDKSILEQLEHGV